MWTRRRKCPIAHLIITFGGEKLAGMRSKLKSLIRIDILKEKVVLLLEGRGAQVQVARKSVVGI